LNKDSAAAAKLPLRAMASNARKASNDSDGVAIPPPASYFYIQFF